MSEKALYAILAAVLCLSAPIVARALSDDGAAKALVCGNKENPICLLYQVCKPILDKYPDSEITGKGKDCTLTVEARQLIIRRKKTDGNAGYFFYAKRLNATGPAGHP
jgi:hypothetical protein